MKKLLKSIVCFLIFSLSINLAQTAYGQDEAFDLSQYSESNMDVKEFSDKISQAANEIENVEEDIKVDILVETAEDEDQSNLTGNFKLLYDQTQSLASVILNVEVDDGNQLQKNQVYMPNGEKSLWIREDSQDNWTNQTPAGPLDQYHSKPNYLLVLDTILDLQDDLKILENEDAYVLTPKDDSVDLFHAFQDHYDLKFDGNPNDLDQQAIFIFDKDNFNLSQVHLKFFFETEEGRLNMDVLTDFSNWNQLDPSIFEQNPEEATIESSF